jgi:hypothetical protein
MTMRSRLALAFALLMGISACDTSTTTATPASTTWSVTPAVDHSYLSSAEYSAATSFYAAALRSTGVLITSNTSTSSIPTLSIPASDTMVKIYVAGMKGADTLWSGFSYFVKGLAGSTIILQSTGGYTPPVTVTDNTPLYDQSGTLESGAQAATPGSFISVRGDAGGPFVVTTAQKTSADEALIDLSFFAMSGTAKSSSGTPSFVSSSLVNTTWGTTNKTIVKELIGYTASEFKTVQDIIDALGSSTSTQAEAYAGGLYALKLSNGTYALLTVTSITGANGSASVKFGLKTTSIPTSNPGTTGDLTAVKDQGGTLDAGAQSSTYGSFISVRGDSYDPAGFTLTSGEMTTIDQGSMDICFYAMSGTAKSSSGTPSFVSSSLVNTTWGTTNKTIVKELIGYTASEFKTVQDIIDALGSSTSTQAEAYVGGLYALKLSNGKYAVIQVTSLIGSAGSATVGFRIIK